MIHDEILGLLEAEEVGTPGSDLFWGFLPDSPDSCAAFFEYAGEPAQETKAGVYRELPRLQVITRARDYGAAMARAYAIRAAFLSVRDRRLGEALYDRIRPLQSRPFGDPAGRDGGKRSRVILNYRLERRPP